MRLTELTGSVIFPWVYVGKFLTHYEYRFATDDQVEFKVYFSHDDYADRVFGISVYEISFAEFKDGRLLSGITGSGDAVAVFSTVIDICKDFLTNQENPDAIAFGGVDDLGKRSGSRSNLYAAAAPKLAQKFGRVAKVHRDSFSTVVYLIKPDKVDQVTKLYRDID